MKTTPKELEKEITQAYKETKKKKIYESSISLRSALVNEKFIKDYTLIDPSSLESIQQLTQFSNPTIIFPDETVEVKIGKYKKQFLFKDLLKVKNADLSDIILKSNVKDYTDVKIKVVKPGDERTAFEKALPETAERISDLINKKIEKIIKHKVSEDFIYHISCDSNEMECVFDGTNGVASGNTWDFHPGCCGLSKYKKIKLGDWNGAGSLASLLSLGLNKKIKKINVDEDEFDLLCYNNLKTTEPEKKKGQTLSELVYDNQRKEQKKYDDWVAGLKKQKKVAIKDMISVLEDEYQKGVFSEDEYNGGPKIRIKYGHFYSYEDGLDEEFSAFVKQFPGWYVEVMDAESIAILPANW